MNKITKFPSGLRLAFQPMPCTKSVAVGIYVGTGSVNEDATNNGISHFIEHMVFKGTSNRSAYDIANEMESVGAQINAFTSRNVTSFYTISTWEHTEKCFDVLSDIFFNASFNEDDIKKEKSVVLEEISMSLDDPSDLAYDNFNTAFYGNKGLGRTILGTVNNVKSFTEEDLRAYMSEHYTADNVVIAVAGAGEEQEIIALVEKYFEKNMMASDIKKKNKRAPKTYSRVIKKHKPIEQANIVIGFPSYEFGHKNMLALTLFTQIFGGGMSSRLFQNVREKRGLAYEVYALPSSYKNSGTFSIFVGTNPTTAKQAIEVIREEILKIKADGLTDEEFKKGKEQLKSSVVLGGERSVAVMRAVGQHAIMNNLVYDLDERLSIIEKITKEDVEEAINFIFDFEKVSVSYVGKKIDCDLLATIKGTKEE